MTLTENIKYSGLSFFIPLQLFNSTAEKIDEKLNAVLIL